MKGRGGRSEAPPSPSTSPPRLIPLPPPVEAGVGHSLPGWVPTLDGGRGGAQSVPPCPAPAVSTHPCSRSGSAFLLWIGSSVLGHEEKVACTYVHYPV